MNPRVKVVFGIIGAFCTIGITILILFKKNGDNKRHSLNFHLDILREVVKAETAIHGLEKRDLQKNIEKDLKIIKRKADTIRLIEQKVKNLGKEAKLKAITIDSLSRLIHSDQQGELARSN